MSLLTTLRLEEGYSKYATADGMSFRDAIEAEQLLKAADDLTDDTYWTVNVGSTVVDQGGGEFLYTKDAQTWRSLYEDMQNWIPAWAGTIGYIFELKAGTLDTAVATVVVDGSNAATSTAVLSGPGSAVHSTDVVNISNLSSTVYTRIIVVADATAWATSVRPIIYIDGGNADAGTQYIQNVQLVLGDTAKPRPTQTSPDDWMMAYRPHNRVTADGGARYSVVDSEGLVSVGDCTDIKLSPASNSAFDHPADFRAEFVMTAEDGKYCYHYFRKGAGANYLQVGLDSGRSLVVRNYVGTLKDNMAPAETLTDGVSYRFVVSASGSDIFVAVDEETMVDAAVTDAGNNSTAGGIIGFDYVTAPTYITTESYPRKATGIIKAGPVATPAYGDPGIWFTQPDGSAFAVGASDAVMFTAKAFTVSSAHFGFDFNTAGAIGTPMTKMLGSKNISANTANGDETLQAWADGQTKTFMQLLRSDTHGSQFLLYDSGKQWKRFNVNDDAIPAASAYPAISNYNAALFITDFALLDLSPIHDAEFVEVTDTKTAPASTTEFTIGANFHLNLTWTEESGKYVAPRFRWTDDEHWIQPLILNGNLVVQHRNTGVTTELGGLYGFFSDGVAYECDVIGFGSALYFFIDKVLKVTAVDPGYELVAGGKLLHNLATNDIVLTTHPYPALGGSKLGATDRQVCPQANDTGTADADCLAILRATQVPSAGNLQVELRKVGSDEITYDVDSAGKPILYENATARITGNNADVSSDDDNYIDLNGAAGEIFTNGATDGSTSSIAHLTGVTWKIASLGTAGAADALELWSKSVNLFKV